jgi:putative membrane protein
MRRLHPATMIVAFLPKIWEALRQMLPFLFFSFVSPGRDWTDLIVAAIGILGGFGAIGAYVTTRFDIADGQILHSTGWIFRRNRRIPLDHVQNVNLKQGVLERALKVATVEVETAAGAQSELKLQVLAEADAERLRAELLAAAELADAKGAGPEIEAPVEEEVYRMSRSDMLLGALTENHLLRLVMYVFPLLGFGMIAQAGIGFGAITRTLPGWLLAVGAFGILGAAVALGWIVGGVGYALRYANFTVRREAKAYRVSHGMFARMQFSIRRGRIEYAIVSATLWQRWVGRCTVKVGTAGAFGEQGAVAPLALMVREEDVATAVEAAVPGTRLRELEWKRLPRFYLYVTSLRHIIGLAVLGVISYGLFFYGPGPATPRILWLFLGLFWIGQLLSLVDTLLAYGRAAYALGEDVLAVRLGFFTRNTMVMPFNRMELVSTTHPFWWIRRGLTTLYAQAMVHIVAVPMLPADEAERIAERLRRESASRQAAA